MTTQIDIGQLAGALEAAASGVVTQDVSQVSGFARDQLTAIAHQSALVAAGIVDGSITPALRGYFLDSIVEMTKSFANSLAGLIDITIEELWNAMVKVVWAAIETATGLALAVP
jgi:hypothetical protein